MPFPNFPNKYKGKSVLTPQNMIAYRQQMGALPKGPAPKAVLLCLERGLPERMRRKHPYRRVGRLNGDLYALKKTSGKVAVLTNFGLGSPLMVALAEELIAWGVQKLISIAMSGGLQPDLGMADIVVCERAIRDEGASHHYLPTEKYVSADAELVGKLAGSIQAQGLTAQIGTTWSTDATYRETDLEVREYQAEGVKTVEMESAGLFSVCQVRGVPAASAFVVGDSLADGQWHGPQDMAPIDRSFNILYDAAIEVLSSS